MKNALTLATLSLCALAGSIALSDISQELKWIWCLGMAFDALITAHAAYYLHQRKP